MVKEILYDKITGNFVELPEGEFSLTIGRASSNDIPVPIHAKRGEEKLGEILRGINPPNMKKLEDLCRTISSQSHAVLTRESGKVYIKDNNSTGGTEVKTNSGVVKPVFSGEKHPIFNGYALFLGKYPLEYLAVENPSSLNLPSGNEFKIYRTIV